MKIIFKTCCLLWGYLRSGNFKSIYDNGRHRINRWRIIHVGRLNNTFTRYACFSYQWWQQQALAQQAIIEELQKNIDELFERCINLAMRTAQI